MNSLLRIGGAVVAGGLSKYWHPGLDTAQNSITSLRGMAGPGVTFVWLILSFVWALFGALVGHTAGASVIFYVESRRSDRRRAHSSEVAS